MIADNPTVGCGHPHTVGGAEHCFDVIDFFCGCGGMSYGFHEASRQSGFFKVIAAFDIDKYAGATYETNLGLKPIATDLAEEAIEDIVRAVASQRTVPNKPLLVIGCAPCQGFSAHRRKDPRHDSRNYLIRRFAEIAVALEPTLVIMENVSELLGKAHCHHYESFRSTLESAGYIVSADTINMAEYGVPQKRMRALVLASRIGEAPMPEPILERRCFRTVRDAIGLLPALGAGECSRHDPMHITSRHKPETVEMLKLIPLDGGSRPPGVGPACLDRVSGFGDVYGRLFWDRPSVTITARCRTPSCGRFVHPEQHRGLSVREAALLQSFPPSYMFEGPFDDKYKQIGNAVPPAFSRHLAIHLEAWLRSHPHASVTSDLEAAACD